MGWNHTSSDFTKLYIHVTSTQAEWRTASGNGRSEDHKITHITRTCESSQPA